MDQWQRQQYLEALNVDCLVPRFVLPGAKPSKVCQLPPGSFKRGAPSVLDVTKLKSTRSDLTQQQDSRSASPASSAAALLKDLQQEPAGRNLTAGRPAKPQTGKSDQPSRELNIQLVFARHTAGLLLVVPCPRGRLSNEEQRLFNDICYALSADSGDNWRYESFSWPAKNSRLRLAGEQAARDTLWTFFMTRFKHADTTSCLLFGEPTVRYLYPADSDWGAIRAGQLRLAQTDKQPLVTEALTTMLDNPMLKKNVWLQLKALSSVVAAS